MKIMKLLTTCDNPGLRKCMHSKQD